ncbi:hypothetical protein [uncultured Cohaesibacter sp.]|uniref:hypothetical protein n=1 Tax=uncultured Cohaesibacter sp. TaxID=1002546 RepID=UPI0029C976D3|nr:hypothetical protein [uncultured Cohaesibacter sp.]
MARASKRPSAVPFIPPLGVRTWQDPVSGNLLYQLTGPFQLTDPRYSKISRGEVLALIDDLQAVLESSKNGEAA